MFLYWNYVQGHSLHAEEVAIFCLGVLRSPELCLCYYSGNQEFTVFSDIEVHFQCIQRGLAINEMKLFIGQQRKEHISNKRYTEKTTDM